MAWSPLVLRWPEALFGPWLLHAIEECPHDAV